MGQPSPEAERRMRAYIEAWNDHNPEAIVEFLSDECDQYSRDGLRDIAEAWFTAFPDLTHEIKELVADGDWVLARLILHGTHQGTFRGIPATGNEIEVADHVSTRFEYGLIMEHHANVNFRALFEQLGVSGAPNKVKQENKALVEQYFRALNDRDKAAFKETMAEDFTYGDIEGPDEMAENDWKWLDAMDLIWHVQGMHAGEDFVTTRLRVTGTHVGEILGLEPTGKSFEISALTLSRIEERKIVEWWGEWDFAGMLNQIGAIDSPVYDT